MSILTFESTDNKFLVKIDTEIINIIEKECIKSENKETGGILIGSYSENGTVATIKSVTGPTEDSKLDKFRFKRGVNGLIEILNNKWNLGEYYIGEWHFHPNSSSKPSSVDNEQMNKLLRDNLLKCREPILFIMGGNQHNGFESSVHVYTKSNRIRLSKNNSFDNL